jgi:hypothetical protein
MNADDLAIAMEKAAPEWQRLVSRALEFEAALQKGKPARPSPKLAQTLVGLTQQLEAAADDAQSAAFGDATRVARFLWEWKVLGSDGRVNDADLDAAQVHEAFRREFFPQFETIRRHYDQFLQNFGYQYRRRNLRQTFTIAFIITVLLNLPFEQVYLRATALTPEQAVALAESAQRLYTESQKVRSGATASEEQKRLQALAKEALEVANRARVTCTSPPNASAADAPITCENAAVDPATVWAAVSDGRLFSLRYLIGCLISAVLITFGAPFWNDVSSSLLRAARPRRDQTGPAAPDRPISTEVA